MLIDNSDTKTNNLISLDYNGAWVDFVALTDEVSNLINNGSIDPQTTYLDSYSAYEWEWEILSWHCVNIENEQKLIYVRERVEAMKYDEDNREYNVITNSYYDWTSEAKKMSERKEAIEEKLKWCEDYELLKLQKELKELEKEWNEKISNLSCDNYISFKDL